jgi:hypothetical protein
MQFHEGRNQLQLMQTFATFPCIPAADTVNFLSVGTGVCSHCASFITVCWLIFYERPLRFSNIPRIEQNPPVCGRYSPVSAQLF